MALVRNNTMRITMDNGDVKEAQFQVMDGSSAFEIWVDSQEPKSDGSAYTVEDFLEAIKGEKGADGQKGADGEKGEKGEQGYGLRVKGSLADREALASLTDVEVGDIYTISSENICVIRNDAGTWDEYDLSAIQGEKGDTGEKGADGKSAYELYVASFVSSDEQPEALDEASWLASLKGDKGDTGEKGSDGDAGVDGVSIESVTIESEIADPVTGLTLEEQVIILIAPLQAEIDELKTRIAALESA